MDGNNKKTMRRWSTVETPKNYAKAVVHDTELMTALKQNTEKPSHQYDMARLERHAEDHRSGLSAYEDELRLRLCKAVFVGHVNTDLDSVAGAMGAAALFGGTAALAEPLNKLNGEIVFALKNCGLEPPRYFDELPESDTCDVCLVDHTEEKQMVPSLRSSITDRIVGVIDHHALAKSFQTKKPIYMDLRPWGSMSTIVGYLFVSHRRALPKPLAVLLLQAILSDTLNLRSVTTTDADRNMVALLHSYGGIGNAKLIQSKGLYQDSDIDFLSKKQFQQKTNWVVALGPYEMVRGDQKDFACGPWKFGISVLEVTDTSKVLECAGDILLELRLLKKEKALTNDRCDLDRTMELDFAFLFVVNVVEQRSILLICGGRELALARAAFMGNDDDMTAGVTLQAASPNIQAPGSTIKPEETAMLLPKGHVSRKAQFVPAFFKAIEDFEYEEQGLSGPRSQLDYLNEDTAEIAASVQEKLSISKDSGRRPQRRQSSLRMSYHTNAMKTAIFQEQVCDEELVKVNEQKTKDRNGNLYDSVGRVVRPYMKEMKETILTKINE